MAKKTIKQTIVTAKSFSDALGEAGNKRDLSGRISIAVGSGENAVTVLVKDFLTLEERRDLVGNIVNMVFVKDANGDVLYCPYFKKLAYEVSFIMFLTNVVLPKDLNEIWAFLRKTDLANAVIQALPKEFIGEIVNEANELIEFRKAKLANTSEFDELISGIVDLVKTVGKKLDESDGKAILEYLKENLPDLKDEIERGFQEQVAEETAK